LSSSEYVGRVFATCLADFHRAFIEWLESIQFELTAIDRAREEQARARLCADPPALLMTRREQLRQRASYRDAKSCWIWKRSRICWRKRVAGRGSCTRLEGIRGWSDLTVGSRISKKASQQSQWHTYGQGSMAVRTHHACVNLTLICPCALVQS